MKPLEPFYNFKNFNLYEYSEYISGDAKTPIRDTLISIDEIEYSIVHAIEERVDWGRDSDPSVRGVYFKLILSDDKELIQKAKKIAQHNLDNKISESALAIKNFKKDLNNYLSKAQTIPIRVQFNDKEEFKHIFNNRTQWNASEKAWYLRFEYSDFKNLAEDEIWKIYGKCFSNTHLRIHEVKHGEYLFDFIPTQNF